MSKCLLHFIENKNTTFWIVKSIGNLSANNPNNQTKLGLSGACEILCELLKSILPSQDLKSLLSTIKTEKSIYNNSNFGENNDNSRKEINLENGNLAKWVFWTIGNMIEIGVFQDFIVIFFYYLFCYYSIINSYITFNVIFCNSKLCMLI